MYQPLRTTWRRDLLSILILAALAIVVWWLFAFQPFAGLSPSAFGDSFDYAQIGRNIWRDGWQQGITTYQIPPLALSVTDRLPFPDIIRAPLYPITLALAFALFGPWDRTIAVGTGAFFLLSVPVLYLLGRRVFSPTVAFLGTLVYILSDWVLKMSVSGLSEPLYVLLFLAMICFAYDSAQKLDSRASPLLAGALAGLAYLTRYNTILFLPLLALYLFLAGREHRWLRLVLLLVAWGVVASPWLIRNLILFHQPLFSMQQWAMLMQTPTYPGFVLWKYVDHPSIPAFFVDHWPEIAAKVRDTLLDFYHNVPVDMSLTGGSPYTLMLFVASLFRRLDRPQAALRRLVGAMVLVQLLGLTILHLIPRLFFPFYPLFLLFGMDLLVSWSGRLLAERGTPRLRRLLRAAVLAGVLILLTLPVLENVPAALQQGLAPRLLPPQLLQEYGPALDYLQESTEPGAVLMSDAMDLVSWYGDRACIWIPAGQEMVAQIEARASVEGIYLTQRMFAWSEDEAWYPIYLSRPETILDGRYHLEKIFADGSLFYRRTR